MAVEFKCPFTQEDLDNLDRAIASGASTVEFCGKKQVYRKLTDLYKARNYVYLMLCKCAGEKISRPGVMRQVCVQKEPNCGVCGCVETACNC